MAYGMKYTNGKKADTAAFPFKTEKPTIEVNETSLYKTPTGPRAEKKEVEENDDVPLSPGFEDPIKIQKVQREGITPNSQEFGKKAASPNNYAFGNYSKVADTQLGCDDCDNGRQPCNCK